MTRLLIYPPAKGTRGKRGFVITNELKRVESRFAYRGRGIVFTFRFNNERHVERRTGRGEGDEREKFPARNGKQIAEFNSFHRVPLRLSTMSAFNRHFDDGDACSSIHSPPPPPPPSFST